MRSLADCVFLSVPTNVCGVFCSDLVALSNCIYSCMLSRIRNFATL